MRNFPDFQLATFAGALIAASVILGIFTWQRMKDKRTLQNALFAELRHIRQHYRYAGPELPARGTCVYFAAHSSRNPELKKRLKWSKLGELITVKDLSRYAILGPAEMQLLLQISLRIRNTDLLIDMLLASPSTITDEDLDEVRDRMEYGRESANKLIAYMERQNSRLSSIAEPE